MVLRQRASAKHRGIEQRAPPIFGRAAITLGIGPHSSMCMYCTVHNCCTQYCKDRNNFPSYPPDNHHGGKALTYIRYQGIMSMSAYVLMEVASGNQDLTYLDATGHSWITSEPTKATVHPVQRSGALKQPTCALVANAKRCHILSTAAHSPSWRGLQWLHSADDVATEWQTYDS